MKRCTKGAECVHPDGPELPESEFYDYSADGGQSYIRCKACVSADQRERDKYKDFAYVSEIVKKLKSKRKESRLGLLYDMVQDRHINKKQFRDALRFVEF